METDSIPTTAQAHRQLLETLAEVGRPPGGGRAPGSSLPGRRGDCGPGQCPPSPRHGTPRHPCNTLQ